MGSTVDVSKELTARLTAIFPDSTAAFQCWISVARKCRVLPSYPVGKNPNWVEIVRMHSPVGVFFRGTAAVLVS
jgi:hypothetical protein